MFTIDQKVSTIERWRLFGALSPHACAGAKHAKANVADSAIAFKFFLLKFIVIVYKYSVFCGAWKRFLGMHKIIKNILLS